jgi:hypothetical protein
MTSTRTDRARPPVIRNEELVLTRAEARWFTGDKANAVRRYSLLLEGFRWVDYRRFNLVQTLPKNLRAGRP